MTPALFFTQDSSSTGGLTPVSLTHKRLSREVLGLIHPEASVQLGPVETGTPLKLVAHVGDAASPSSIRCGSSSRGAASVAHVLYFARGSLAFSD